MKPGPACFLPAGRRHALALLLSLALHVAVLAWVAVQHAPEHPLESVRDDVLVFELAPAPAVPAEPAPVAEEASVAAPAVVQAAPAVQHEPASMAAPPVPSAQDWALASSYKLKNSKRYRYTWGQQVRSMMGTAYEGADQGLVRFRIEIAPDGRLTRLETLWTTSPVAERLVRQAVQAMPPLPPTPTGLPLVFEQTIAFQPFETGGPPLYRNDCLPDPPAFRNPFAWDGQSARVHTAVAAAEPADAQALEECLKSLPEDTVEAESAHDRRQLEQWRSSRLGR